MNNAEHSNEAIKLGRIQVEFQATVGRPEQRARLTQSELIQELTRMCARENVGFRGFEYLENYLITHYKAR